MAYASRDSGERARYKAAAQQIIDRDGTRSADGIPTEQRGPEQLTIKGSIGKLDDQRQTEHGHGRVTCHEAQRKQYGAQHLDGDADVGSGDRGEKADWIFVSA